MHTPNRHHGETCSKLNHTQDAITFDFGERVSCWEGYLGRRGGEDGRVGWKSSQAGSEAEARGEGIGGEGNRQLGKGVAVPSPEANEGGFNVEERQDVIMLVSKWRDMLRVPSIANNFKVVKYLGKSDIYEVLLWEHWLSPLNFDFEISVGM